MSSQKLWLAGACLWAFAEATFFFVVPDVLLTAAVLTFGLALTLRLAAVASLAAAIGGFIMWRWGVQDAESARAFLLSVPLIGQDLLVRVQTEIAGNWPLNLTKGAVTGAPYKIYAVDAGASGISLYAFFLVSVVARFARFAFGAAAFAAAVYVVRRMGLAKLTPWLLAGVWVLIYGVYIVQRLSA